MNRYCKIYFQCTEMADKLTTQIKTRQSSTTTASTTTTTLLPTPEPFTSSLTNTLSSFAPNFTEEITSRTSLPTTTTTYFLRCKYYCKSNLHASNTIRNTSLHVSTIFKYVTFLLTCKQNQY